jgi:hypothetical protein
VSKWRLSDKYNGGFVDIFVTEDFGGGVIATGVLYGYAKSIIRDHNAVPKMREALAKGIAVIHRGHVEPADATEALQLMRAALEQADDR